jgi:thiamine biosynthesis lipoprotein
MTARAKNAVYSVVLIAAVAAVWWWRNRDVPILIEGKTMGTTYHITYFDEQNRNFKASVDSLLILVNKSISTWDSTSEISQFNKAQRSIKFELPYFLPPLQVSQKVVSATHGAFDPTVMPLVDVWGFGPKKIEKPDTTQVEKVLQYVGFEKLSFNQDSLWKNDARVQLDFSGIGQGYGADVVADFLKSKGVVNALVEVGGEGIALGRNIKTDKPWSLGLVNPLQPQAYIGYITLENKSFSTSGNYFNYRIVDGRRFSHTIDPSTGYPTNKAILSASVFAADCTTADAWATAIMCMGHEKAIELLKSQPSIGVCLLYSNESGGVERFVSENVAALISFEEPK